MLVSGEIIILKTDAVKFGFVKVKGLDDIFFSTKTSFLNVSFNDLKMGDKVRLIAKETSRGLFAESLVSLNRENASIIKKAPDLSI